MSESNGTWGQLAEHDEEAASAWDSYSPLPDEGENATLDAFVRRKNLTIPGLVRVGARLADDHVLVFGYEAALKYRDMNNGLKWSRMGSTFPRLKIVRAGTEPTEQVIVCEGETDAARLTVAYDVDVAVLPAGARRVTQEYVDQLAGYPIVLVGLDDDEAGAAGTAKLAEALPQAIAWRPEGSGDWCDTADEDLPELVTEAPEIPEAATLPLIVPAGDLFTLEMPEIASWFDGAVLPVGGTMVLHGWAKTFKSFIAFDMMASLAQGQPWCGFDATEEPCRVLVVQFEIPPPYYRERIAGLREQAEDDALFDENFLTYMPLSRPRIVAGHVPEEDKFLHAIEEAGVQVVLFDPLRRMTGGADMNDEKDMRKVLGFFERINDLGVTVVYSHHDGKEAARSRGGEALGMTGSGAIAGDPDSIVSIALPRGEKWGESTRMNLNFLLRNAPSPEPRGMEIHETGRISYQDEPHGQDEDDSPDSDGDYPPI